MIHWNECSGSLMSLGCCSPRSKYIGFSSVIVYCWNNICPYLHFGAMWISVIQLFYHDWIVYSKGRMQENYLIRSRDDKQWFISVIVWHPQHKLDRVSQFIVVSCFFLWIKWRNFSTLESQRLACLFMCLHFWEQQPLIIISHERLNHLTQDCSMSHNNLSNNEHELS